MTTNSASATSDTGTLAGEVLDDPAAGTSVTARRGRGPVTLRSAAGAVRWVVESAGVLGLVGVATALLNVGFYVVVAHRAGPPAYGAVAALLLLVTVAGLLAAGTEHTVARIAVLHRGTPLDLLRLSTAGLWPWLAIAALLAAASGPIASYLNLASAAPVALASLAFGTVMLSSVALGVMFGRGRYATATILLFLNAAVRLGLGGILTGGDGAVSGAVVATLIPSAGLAVAAFALAWHAARSRVSAEFVTDSGRLAVVGGEGVSGALLAASLWIVWGMPLVFARHFLSPGDAGSFAAAWLFAGGLVWITSIFIKAFHPTVLRRLSSGIVVLGLVVAVGICAVGAGVLVAFGPRLMTGLLGDGYVIHAAVFALLCLAASANAVATYALWVARALRRRVLVTSLAIALAVPAELVAGVVLGESVGRLAAGPAVAMVAGSIAAFCMLSLGARRLPASVNLVIAEALHATGTPDLGDTA